MDLPQAGPGKTRLATAAARPSVGGMKPSPSPSRSDGATSEPVFPHIGCCVDESDAADAALAHARGLHDADRTRLSVVYVVPDPPMAGAIDGTPPGGSEDVAAAVRRRLEACARDIPGASPVLLEGLPGPAICAWAAEADVDLLIAASHEDAWGMAVLGSVTRHLVDHAPCPVLVVRPGRIPTPTAEVPR